MNIRTTLGKAPEGTLDGPLICWFASPPQQDPHCSLATPSSAGKHFFPMRRSKETKQATPRSWSHVNKLAEPCVCPCWDRAELHVVTAEPKTAWALPASAHGRGKTRRDCKNTSPGPRGEARQIRKGRTFLSFRCHKSR